MVFITKLVNNIHVHVNSPYIQCTTAHAYNQSGNHAHLQRPLITHMEDDYMSDIFLEDDDVEQKERKNIKRKGGTICEKKKEVKRTKKEEETRIRKEGLSKPIPRDNLGYSMLYKMGYKSGTALGKTGMCVLIIM